MRVICKPEDFQVEGKQGQAWLAEVQDEKDYEQTVMSSAKKGWELVEDYICLEAAQRHLLFYRPLKAEVITQTEDLSEEQMGFDI